MEEQIDRETLVDTLTDIIAETVYYLRQLKEMDGRSEQGRYTAIVLTEAEKFRAVAERMLKEK